MRPLARVTWLFTRGKRTVRINRSPDGLSVTVSGPGHDERNFGFRDHATATEFLRLYEQDLERGGWALQAVVERRSPQNAGRIPRSGERRRRTTGPDDPMHRSPPDDMLKTSS